MNDGLKDKHRQAVIDILAAHPGVEKVVLFGSRAMGTFTPESDVDICLFGDSLSLTDQARLARKIDELPMPQRVDLLRHKTIKNKKLLAHIRKHGAEWYRRAGSQQPHADKVERTSAMAGEWRQGEWGDFATLEYGKSLRDYRADSGRYRVFGTNGPIGWYDEPLCTHSGVIVGRKGAYRGIHYSAAPFFVIDTAFYLEPKQEMDLRWAYYCLLTYDINGLDSGSAIPSTSRESFYRLPVRVPPLKEQRAIACILGALDDKIELNRRRNKTLEAMARAIFKSWFVDFDPVRAKVAGQHPPGLKPDIAALFPDAFEDSELGEIPKGWEITSLADQITANKGLSYKGQRLCEAEEGLPMHNLNSVYEGGGYKTEGVKWYNGEYRPAHLLKPGDVIVTNTEQGFDYLLIGYSAIVPERFGPQGLFSHHIFRIQPKTTSDLPAWFVYLLLRTQRFHDVVAGHSNGTTVNMLPLDGLQRPKFTLPPREIVERFGRLFIPTQRRLERIHDENTTLAALRDALLPKLISGELRVPDAERIVGRAV